jgi:3-carboxy-cis,cis-muconate cycloisomerase
MTLLDSLFRYEPVTKLFADTACLQAMLDFEATLARAESAAGAIPSSAASAIAAKCRAELFDTQKLIEDAALGGNLAIPLVQQLRNLVAAQDEDAANFVHWGATSQDVIDSSLALRVRKALQLIQADAATLCNALATLADHHRATPIVGRTLMQHAVPTTLGMKFAGWLDALGRHCDRLRETHERCLVLQFGGAVGTLASLSSHAQTVAKNLSVELQLPLPQIPWHSHRDRLAEIATTLGLLTGTLGKIASDIALHAQTEIAEIHEPAEQGRGASSTMPHKRNPLACAAILSAATRVPGLVSTMLSAMPQQHERGLGGWHAEWETLPQIVCLTAGALHQLAHITPKLELDISRMQQNLEASKGLIFAEAITAALGQKIPRSAARQLIDDAVNHAVKENTHLRKVLEQEKSITQHFSPAQLDHLFDPRNYSGSASRNIDDVIAAHKSRRPAD